MTKSILTSQMKDQKNAWKITITQQLNINPKPLSIRAVLLLLGLRIAGYKLFRIGRRQKKILQKQKHA